MVTSVQIPEPRPDRLLVFVDTSRSMPAGEAGRLLTAFDRAFRAWIFAKYRRRGIGLEIVETGTGSWWIYLAAAKDLYELLSAEPAILALFMADIDTSMKALTSGDPRDIPKYIRDLLRALGEAGKRAAAEALDVVNVVRVSLDPEAFDLVTRPDTSQPKGRNAHVPKHAALTSEATISPDVAARIDKRARSGSLKARLFRVEGEWYARPKDMHRVLLPLILPDFQPHEVEESGDFIIEGVVEKGSEGYPVAIRASFLRSDPDAAIEALMRRRKDDDSRPPAALPPPPKA